MTTETDVELQRGHCVALLKPYVDARKQRDDAASKLDTMGKLLKGYLDQSGEELWDGEHRIRGYLDSRTGTPDLDTVSLAEKEPDLALWALRHGLLKLDTKAWKALSEKGQEAAQLKGWIANMKGSVALQVKEEK